jgi:hypothetical protein
MQAAMALFGRRSARAKGSVPPPLAPDSDEVALALIAEVRARGIAGELRVAGNYLFITDETGATRHVFLGNVAREYVQAAPAARREVIAAYARLAAQPVGTVKLDLRSRVLPRLTPRFEDGRGEDVTNRLAARPIAGGALGLELAIDAPGMLRVLTASDLAEHGMSESEAHVRAIANLRARSTSRWQELVPGLLRSPWGDYFDGARLALTSLIRNLPIKGTPIAVVPNRCTLLVTGSEELAGLTALAKATELLSAEDQPVHLAPLVLIGEDWRALEPDEIEYALRFAPSLPTLWSLHREHDLQA